MENWADLNTTSKERKKGTKQKKEKG